MQLTVHRAEWVLGDRGEGFAIGELFAEWLALEEPAAGTWPPETVRGLSGVARPLPRWPG